MDAQETQAQQIWRKVVGTEVHSRISGNFSTERGGLSIRITSLNLPLLRLANKRWSLSRPGPAWTLVQVWNKLKKLVS